MSLQDLVPCDHCLNQVSHRKVHRFEDPEGKEFLRLCSTCCPNCFGGAGYNEENIKHESIN